MLILLVSYPYLEKTPFHALLLDSGIGLVFLSGLYAVSRTPLIFFLGLLFIIPAMVGNYLPHRTYDSVPHFFGLGFSVISFVFVTLVMFSDVFKTKQVTTDTLFGAVCVYLLMGLLWASAYTLLEALLPGSFNLAARPEPQYMSISSDFIFFSYTTLTTTGYGDITPATDPARSLVILEHCFGVLYIAVLVARLVSLHQFGDFGQDGQ